MRGASVAMAKIVVASLKSRARNVASGESVIEKRVKDTDGNIKTVYVLDAESRTFGDDFRYVFGKNVAKARRDSKRAIGATDGAIVKR